MTDAIRHVLIAGGGTAGWITAAVLARAFGSRLRITLVESDEIGTVGVGEATIPQIRHLLSFLQIPEADFLRETSGTFKLGIEFTDWGALGSRYIHAFGDFGMPLGLTPFHHFWLRARANGLEHDLWHYSVNARAAIAHRCGSLPQTDHPAITGITPAYHIDASRMALLLRHLAEARGVVRREGRIADVHVDGESGHINALSLQSGEHIEADFFVDCTGFRALLIGEALGVGYEDWRHFLPCDTALAVQSEGSGPMRPYTQSMARPAGWQWRIPLQHRTGNGHVFCSEFTSEDEATSRLLDTIEGRPLTDPRRIRFTTGARKKFWEKNCVAIGLSSGFLEPLESTSIHLIQSAVERLIAHFPSRTNIDTAAREYNRLTREETLAVRDFIILHYKATTRDDTPFWRHCRDMTVPDTLTERMELFRQTGRINRHGMELFTEVGWLQVMLGQGIQPETWQPLAEQLSPAQLDEFLANIDAIVTRAVEALPGHSNYVARHCPAREPA